MIRRKLIIDATKIAGVSKMEASVLMNATIAAKITKAMQPSA